jgi:hypothetical protein
VGEAAVVEVQREPDDPGGRVACRGVLGCPWLALQLDGGQWGVHVPDMPTTRFLEPQVQGHGFCLVLHAWKVEHCINPALVFMEATTT